MLSYNHSNDRQISKSDIKASIIDIKRIIDEINPIIQRIYNKYSYLQVSSFDIYSLVTIIDNNINTKIQEGTTRYVTDNELKKVLIFKVSTRLLQLFDNIKNININNQMHYFDEYDSIKRKINNFKSILDKYNR